MSQLDKELRERIDEPASEEAEREARLSPAEAVAQMRIKVPAQRNRKLRTLLDRVNADDGLKAWWHVSNVNAVKRLGINDHSWVHIQIVANIGLRLLRILAKRGVEPAMVEDYEHEAGGRRGRRRCSARCCTASAWPSTATGTRTGASSSPSRRRASCWPGSTRSRS